MKNETDNLPRNEALNIDVVVAMLPDDEKMTELVSNRSKLYTAYGVKDNDGKFRSVIDVNSVVELLREILGN